MTLVVAAPITFRDPEWGPVSFDLMIFRRFNGLLPEYEVVVE